MTGSDTTAAHEAAPGLLRTFFWGMAALGFVQWITPSIFSVAALNLREEIPVWLAWVPWAGFFVAPVIERYARRLSILAKLQIAVGLILLATAAVLKFTGRLTGALPILALGAIACTVGSAIGWAVFITEVPAAKRCSRLFMAFFGANIIRVIWTGGFLRASGFLNQQHTWSNVWALLFAIWGGIALLFALFTRRGLSKGVATPSALQTSGPVFVDFLQHLLRRTGIGWVALLLIGHSLIDDTFFELMIQLVGAKESTVNPDSLNTTLAVTQGIFGAVAVLTYPTIAQWGLRRCMRPAVIGATLAPLVLIVTLLKGSLDATWLLLAVCPHALFEGAFFIAWTLYLISYVAKREYVLSSYAWLTGFSLVCSFGMRQLNLLVVTTFGLTSGALLLGVGILCLIVAVIRVPLDESALS